MPKLAFDMFAVMRNDGRIVCSYHDRAVADHVCYKFSEFAPEGRTYSVHPSLLVILTMDAPKGKNLSNVPVLITGEDEPNPLTESYRIRPSDSVPTKEFKRRLPGKLAADVIKYHQENPDATIMKTAVELETSYGNVYNVAKRFSLKFKFDPRAKRFKRRLSNESRTNGQGKAQGIYQPNEKPDKAPSE